MGNQRGEGTFYWEGTFSGKPARTHTAPSLISILVADWFTEPVKISFVHEHEALTL